jgi:hypothetical protein
MEKSTESTLSGRSTQGHRHPSLPALLLLLLGCVAICLAACPPDAQALDSSGLVVSLRPVTGPPISYFKLSVPAGRQVDAGQIVLVNHSAKTMRVVLDPVDAQTTNTLGSAYRLPSASVHGSTRWTRLSRRRVTLGPQGQATVAVAVAVSHTAKPGDYLSAVSIEVPARQFTAIPARRVAIVSTERYAIGLEVTLPGPRHPLLRFTGARVAHEPAGLSFLLLADNPGNVILQGVHGWARITRGSRLVARAAIGPGTFVTNTAIAFPVRAPDEIPSQGFVYHVTALMRYRGGVARLDQNVTFGHRAALAQHLYGGPAPPGGSSASWWQWLLLGLLALGIYTACLVLLTRRRAARAESRPSQS